MVFDRAGFAQREGNRTQKVEEMQFYSFFIVLFVL
jgi:hypothetical protein